MSRLATIWQRIPNVKMGLLPKRFEAETSAYWVTTAEVAKQMVGNIAKATGVPLASYCGETTWSA